MVRKHVFALAAAIAIAAPSAASAQLFSGTLSGVSSAVGYRANVTGFSGVGGGFNGVFTSGSTVINFSDFLFWCVDPTRASIPSGSYDLYSASQFVNADPFGWLGSTASRRERTRAIASGVDAMIAAPAGDNGAQRDARDAGQQISWENFTNGSATSGNSAFDASNTFVLVYTPVTTPGPNGLGRAQTYMFQTNALVPEPASMALLASGLLGFGIIARRRRA